MSGMVRECWFALALVGVLFSGCTQSSDPLPAADLSPFSLTIGPGSRWLAGPLDWEGSIDLRFEGERMDVQGPVAIVHDALVFTADPDQGTSARFFVDPATGVLFAWASASTDSTNPTLIHILARDADPWQRLPFLLLPLAAQAEDSAQTTEVHVGGQTWQVTVTGRAVVIAIHAVSVTPDETDEAWRVFRVERQEGTWLPSRVLEGWNDAPTLPGDAEVVLEAEYQPVPGASVVLGAGPDPYGVSDLPTHPWERGPPPLADGMPFPWTAALKKAQTLSEQVASFLTRHTEAYVNYLEYEEQDGVSPTPEQGPTGPLLGRSWVFGMLADRERMVFTIQQSFPRVAEQVDADTWYQVSHVQISATNQSVTASPHRYHMVAIFDAWESCRMATGNSVATSLTYADLAGVDPTVSDTRIGGVPLVGITRYICTGVYSMDAYTGYFLAYGA